MSLQYAEVSELIYPRGDERVTRIGVIPFTRLSFDDEDYGEQWLMGTLPSGRFSDFGGQCEDGETPYMCLLREVDEESSGLLTPLIQDKIDEALKLGESDDVYVWVWITTARSPRTRRLPTEVNYLVFVRVDYVDATVAIKDFTGNEENIAIGWYSKEELDTLPLDKFNTSIQKFIRRFRS